MYIVLFLNYFIIFKTYYVFKNFVFINNIKIVEFYIIIVQSNISCKLNFHFFYYIYVNLIV